MSFAPRDRLKFLAAPRAARHEDPFLPYGHGEALAKEIPNAELVPLEATGHELPREIWDVVVPAILRHTSVEK
jgi:pimeloyl-ACP methyl ester carboxylesterase